MTLPFFPSELAVIVALPAALAVISPLDETAATPELDVVHVIVRPDSALPDASRRITAACIVPPAVTAFVGTVSARVATGADGTGTTVITAFPDLPSTVAVIVAVPTPVAETEPMLDTEATLPLEVAHVIERPLRTLPLASRAIAVALVD